MSLGARSTPSSIPFYSGVLLSENLDYKNKIDQLGTGGGNQREGRIE